MKHSAINIRLISNGVRRVRLFSTSEKPPTNPNSKNVIESFSERSNRIQHNKINKYYLNRRLLSVLSTGEKLSDVLDELSSNSSKILNETQIFDCLKMFRSYGKYQHCLEILEWLDKGKIHHTDREYALRVNIIYKVKGLNEAEKYFDSLPPNAKKKSTYGALLNCYCSENMTDKALGLFEKMDEMNYASNDNAFSNLMCLYLKVGHPEKVPPLVEEMKQRNIPLHIFSYQTWIESYARLNDLEGIERVMDEVRKNEHLKNDGKIYSCHASVYIKVGLYQKAVPSLKKTEEILDDSVNVDHALYRSLIAHYADVGDSVSVSRVWDKLKLKFKACNNASYLSMLQALSKLDNLEHLKMCYKEWSSRYKIYDSRLPSCVIKFYLARDMFDEAEMVLNDAVDRAGEKIWPLHVPFVDYFLEKREINSALKHVEVALADQWPWQRYAEKFDLFFEYFTEKKDADGAEKLSQMLQKTCSLPLTVQLGLLQSYAAAGIPTPAIHRRMAQCGLLN
ncbi:unnamed protein product [Amaranthus hypochondriacus]